MGSRSCLRDAASSWIPRPLSHPSFLPACTSFANTSRFHLTYRRNSRYTYTKHQATCDAQSKPSPVCAVHTIFLPLCWAFHMRSFSLLVGFIETANGIACPPPKERILLRITVSKHSRTCIMALLFGALGRHETSCFFAPWKTAHARPLGLAEVVYGQHSYVPCY